MDLETANDTLTQMLDSINRLEEWSPEWDEAILTAKDAMSYRHAVTPLKIKPMTFSAYHSGYCPRCRCVVLSNQYCCDWCGQKLKWEEGKHYGR